jgi:hypothetical protein
MRDARS